MPIKNNFTERRIKMEKAFSNASQVQCIFTDNGITFTGTEQEIFFPYGCIDSLKMSLMGILQATSRARVCTFAVDRKDRAEVKEAVKAAHEAMKTAPFGEVQVIDTNDKNGQEKVSSELSPEEQLKEYKAMFVQGIISKEEYDAKKVLLRNRK